VSTQVITLRRFLSTDPLWFF